MGSKAVANTKAVDERQRLQTVSREEKTAARTLTGLQEAHNNMETRKAELEAEVHHLMERKEEVRGSSVIRARFFTIVTGGRKSLNSSVQFGHGETRGGQPANRVCSDKVRNWFTFG